MLKKVPKSLKGLLMVRRCVTSFFLSFGVFQLALLNMYCFQNQKNHTRTPLSVHVCVHSRPCVCAYVTTYVCVRVCLCTNLQRQVQSGPREEGCSGKNSVKPSPHSSWPGSQAHCPEGDVSLLKVKF